MKKLSAISSVRILRRREDFAIHGICSLSYIIYLSMNSRFSGTNRGIMSKRSFIIIAVLTLSFSVSAKDVLKEISLQDFQTYKVEDLNNGDGVLVKPNGFLSSSDVSDSDKKKLPGNVNSQFNDETQLITHHVSILFRRLKSLWNHHS
jgi:hypothetical protein